MDADSDLDLAEALAAGQVDALARLYDRYGSLAYSVALRVLGDPGRAEDVVQDAFLKLWHSAGGSSVTAEHDALENAVAAYVLDVCDEDEREAVRAHVEGCASCRELARRLTQAADALPLACQEVRPPARLRERILAAAAVSPP